MPRVLVASGDSCYRKLVEERLGAGGACIVGHASDAFGVLRKATVLRPDVVALDPDLPPAGVAAGAREILAGEPRLRLCVLARSEREPDVIASVLAGVRGYLLLDAPAERLVRGLEAVAAGGAMIAPRMAARLLSAFAALPGGDVSPHEGPDALTEREREILTMVAGGASNRQIAEALWISPHTVKVHVHNILEKLRVRNRGHAVALAVQEQLVSPSIRATVRVARPAHDNATTTHGFFASKSAAHLARLAE